MSVSDSSDTAISAQTLKQTYTPKPKSVVREYKRKESIIDTDQEVRIIIDSPVKVKERTVFLGMVLDSNTVQLDTGPSVHCSYPDPPSGQQIVIGSRCICIQDQDSGLYTAFPITDFPNGIGKWLNAYITDEQLVATIQDQPREQDTATLAALNNLQSIVALWAVLNYDKSPWGQTTNQVYYDDVIYPMTFNIRELFGRKHGFRQPGSIYANPDAPTKLRDATEGPYT